MRADNSGLSFTQVRHKMRDCGREVSPDTTATSENYKRRSTLESMWEEKYRVSQELRETVTKYDALQTKFAALDKYYDAEKSVLSRSLAPMFGAVTSPPGLQRLSGPSLPLSTSNGKPFENSQGVSCQLDSLQSALVGEDAPARHRLGTTHGGRISDLPRLTSSTSPTVQPILPPPDHSTKNSTAADGRSLSEPCSRHIEDCFHPKDRRKRGRHRRGDGPESVPGHVRKKAKTGWTTSEVYILDLADEFQKGLPHHNHMIVQGSPEMDERCVLRCDDHGLPFDQTHRVAVRHMEATGHQGPRGHPQINSLKSVDSWFSAINTIGLRALSCDATRAQQNNEAFTRAHDTGHKPLRPSSYKQPPSAMEVFQILLRPQPAPQNQDVVGDASSPRRGRKHTSRMRSACHSTDATYQTTVVNLHETICPSNGSVAPAVSNSTERRRPFNAGLADRGSSHKSANDSSPSTSEQSLHPRVPSSSMGSSISIHREPPGLANATLKSTGTTCSTGNPHIDPALSPNDSVSSQRLSAQQGPLNLAHLRAELEQQTVPKTSLDYILDNDHHGTRQSSNYLGATIQSVIATRDVSQPTEPLTGQVHPPVGKGEAQDAKFFDCPKCSRRYNISESLSSHIRWSHVGTTCLWPGCLATTETEALMIAHLKYIHAQNVRGIGPLDYPCPWPGCTKICLSRSRANLCVREHNSGAKTDCDQGRQYLPKIDHDNSLVGSTCCLNTARSG